MKVKLNVGTGTCRHVNITDLSDRVLDVMMREDFGQDDDDNDSPVRRQIKQVVRRYLRMNPDATLAQIKAMVEAEEL